MRVSAHTDGRGGFTLIELVIGSAIASIILAAAYVCLRAGIVSQRTIETRSDTLQSARVALAMMSADLRGATPLSQEFEFVGMNRAMGAIEAGNLDFATHNYTPRNPHEGDFCEVSYFIVQHPETGGYSLWRRRDSTPDDEPLTGGNREEIIQGVRGLRLDYYDGFEWFDKWGDPEGRRANQDTSLLASNQYGMPEAVRIRLTLEAGQSERKRKETDEPADDAKSGEPAFVLEAVVRLNLAALANTSVGGDTTTGQSGVTTSPPRPLPAGN